MPRRPALRVLGRKAFGNAKLGTFQVISPAFTLTAITAHLQQSPVGLVCVSEKLSDADGICIRTCVGDLTLIYAIILREQFTLRRSVPMLDQIIEF